MKVAFRAGDTLVAYTDGLIERRDEDIDLGQARALDAVWRLRDAPLGEALAVLVDTVRDPAARTTSRSSSRGAPRTEPIAAVRVNRLLAWGA